GQDSDTPAITPTNDAPTIDVVANDFVENSASDGDVAATYTTHDEDGDALTVDFTPGTNTSMSSPMTLLRTVPATATLLRPTPPTMKMAMRSRSTSRRGLTTTATTPSSMAKWS
ncbi:hypothetical protein, partial [Shewanella schlegeliana]|uniref:hypothetical protein n=1 Tax=Shewanella schlegeliana TaxID=190308 RepID=UPI001ED967AC